ncbi:MAG: hypothetical protein SOU03_03455 [Dorea sp.]|nr:hypothetical protein [Dorea sp.]
MEQIRREILCFSEYADVSTWDTGKKAVFAIRRTIKENELLCLANFSEEGQNASMPCLEEKYTDIFTGETLEPQSIWMEPYQYR